MGWKDFIMVDNGIARSAISSAVSRPFPSSVDVRPADDIGLAEYEAFCATAIVGPAQHPLWIRAWIEASGTDALIVMMRRSGVPVFALAMEVVREGPFLVARFPAGDHANGNFAAVAADAHQLSEADARTLCVAIHAARPDIDLISLQRQNPTIGEFANPLAGLAYMRSPNVSLAVDLSGGFDAVLSRHNGRKKRKKFRGQLRKFEEVGGYRVITASTPEEVDSILDAYFEMKAARFAEKGIPNVFAPIEVQTFFRRLYSSCLHLPAHMRPFELRAVEVEGGLVAVHGMSHTPHSILCDFGGMRETAAAQCPGYFFDYLCIEDACNNGKTIYDFSVGDEPYKRSWCDVETWQFDTLLPLTAKGRAAWALATARAHAVRLVKSNAALWSLVKQLRTKVAGTKVQPHQED